MHFLTAVSAGLLILGLSLPASADWHMEYEELIAAMDADAAICSDINPERIRSLQLALEKELTEEQLQDIPCARKTDIYKRTFQQEYLRLVSLTAKERLKSCHVAVTPPDA